MSAYNFQREFVEQILSGEKRTTIRARRKNGYMPKTGERIRLYTGMRTKSCRLLREVTVTEVLPISIDCGSSSEPPSIVLDLNKLPRAECQFLAARDGFKSLDDFYAFFKRQYGDTFNGYLIQFDSE